ncbi:MAG TPA: sporadic carbohydrate cluster 2OG-Fe(II) oxygenase [Aliidongia sp.]|nr:sporadic carbohydrate cluster 2OG-Fe(II) oxygenase [Aliidongia sp.]
MPLPGFVDHGYSVVDAVDQEALAGLRRALLAAAGEILGELPADADFFFNGFHERGLGGAALNDFRMAVIKRFNENCNFADLVFAAFRPALMELVGPDIVVQKSANLVISCPHDEGVGPLHQDAPANSPFEVVVWAPMVDCSGTKSMLVYDKAETEIMAAAVARDPAAFEQLDIEAPGGTYVPVNYGQALMFWTWLYHRTPINIGTETRWSFNIRFKNLFSPYGAKGLLDYFRILHLSPIAALAFDEEARRSKA